MSSGKAGGARRKSSSGGGGGPAAAAGRNGSGNGADRGPATLAAAERFVGRRVSKLFMDEALGKYREFSGEVAEVINTVRKPDGTLDPRFFYFVR